jgi:peptide subunit release factor 1 (eRF1)
MADEHQPYAFLVADQREATLTIVAQTRPTRELDVEATDYPRKQQQGGWSQRRYQARADERVAAFARTVAEEVRKTLDATGVSMLIVAASDVVLSELTDAFLQSVHERIIGSVGLDSSAAHLDIVGAATPLLERTERKRELAAVEAVRDGVAAGGRGVAGAEYVLTALQTGQVMTLVMNDAFSMNGWADYSMPIYGAGDVPRQHPAGGDAKQIVPIALKEEMVRLALQQDAAIEFVRTLSDISEERNAELPQEGSEQRTEAAAMLDAYGGVGAVLRFALDSGQSTADL